MKILQFLAIATVPIPILFSIPDNAFTICPFFHITGLPCFFCGLGHSLIYIYHLDFIGALLYNPFGFIIIFIQWYLILSLFFTSLIKVALKQYNTLKNIGIAIFGLFLLYGLLRIGLLLQKNSI